MIDIEVERMLRDLRTALSSVIGSDGEGCAVMDMFDQCYERIIAGNDIEFTFEADAERSIKKCHGCSRSQMELEFFT